MVRKQFQSKQISDDEIVTAVRSLKGSGVFGAMRPGVAALFPAIPSKVVYAKLRQATLKGKLHGCSSDSCARSGMCLLTCVLGYAVVEEA